ncbi:MAG: hypothetical protein H0X24_20715 [Ktedonobacterales bacterium]|nr:hypothetical protein [Ktedonobacterales bacterium]
MIRPVLYVDLPGIIYALDRRARLVGRPIATFLCAPRYEETRSGLANLLNTMSPVHATARTWICEEHWRLLGVAQGRARPDTTSWDLVYLASMTGDERATPSVLRALLEYAVNAAMMHGQQRLFAQITADDHALAIFHQVGFQRYAEELLYVRESPSIEGLPEPERGLGMPGLTLRRWQRDDVWGLSRLHGTVTPRRVQVAELLGSDELARQFVPRERTWRIPGIEPRDETYVLDMGSHLAAWVRIRQSWAGLPHQLWLMVHPEHAAVAPEVIRFALGRLCENGVLPGAQPLHQPVICQIRDYEGGAIDGLRQSGFIHTDTKDSLVRHLTLRAFSDLAIPGVEQGRINYGVEGLGAVRSAPFQPTRELTACNTRSRMTSTSSWPRSRHTWRRPLRLSRSTRS